MPDLTRFLDATAALHHQLCPRQVLGVRIGRYAADLLDLDLPQTGKRLYTFVETDGCFADGVAVATGCWLGRRTLRLLDYGKVAATFVDTATQHAVRIWPDPDARRRAMQYALNAPDAWHAYLVAYQVMPVSELLHAQEVTVTIDLAALLGAPATRVVCAACREEILNQREICVAGRVVCRACAGEPYVAPTDANRAHASVLALDSDVQP